MSPVGSVSVYPTEINANTGDNIIANCTSLGGPDNVYTWHSLLTGDVKSNRSLLSIRNVSFNNGGTYICNVSNLGGQENSYFDLNSKYCDKGLHLLCYNLVGPLVIQDPVHINVLVSGSIMLQCTVTGVPLPNVTWVYDSFLSANDNDRIPSNNTVISHGTVQSVLALQSVTLYNAGTYQCIAMTSGYNPVISDDANVTVVGKKLINYYSFLLYISATPELLSELINITKNFSDNVLFHCSFSGFPAPDITWYHNGQVLINGAQENVTISTMLTALPSDNSGLFNITSQLSIKYVQTSNNGLYQCMATESIFNTSNFTQSYLNVQGNMI